MSNEWDLYREESDTDEQWELRKAFMVKWKNSYPEPRLVCLASTFINVEFLGVKYPLEVMQEIAELSKEVAQASRLQRQTRLQRTFVSASVAAEDRARGVKRKGGTIQTPPAKSTFIQFVKQGETSTQNSDLSQDSDKKEDDQKEEAMQSGPANTSNVNLNNYQSELATLQCVDVRYFKENMFETIFGNFILLIRPWVSKISNIQASCQACQLQLKTSYVDHMFTISINNRILAQSSGPSRQLSKQFAEDLAWEIIKTKVISVLIKEQWIAQHDNPIRMNDVSHNRHVQDVYGTPIESSVATKMMEQMGWKGGGLGAGAQGIAEPIRPDLRMVSRAGLGTNLSDIRDIKKKATAFMQHYLHTSSLDVDLVFSNEFSKEERAVLHVCAQRQGLASKSYGVAAERFLVVKKKLNPFSIVKAALDEGGNTAKYQVFIPADLCKM